MIVTYHHSLALNEHAEVSAIQLFDESVFNME